MRLLFKQAIKSLFANKIFTSIMILIVFISGGTYTLFQSTSNSFNASYNKVIKNGNLHDAIVKENYSISGTFQLTYIMPTTPVEGIYKTEITAKCSGTAKGEPNDYEKYIKSVYRSGILATFKAPTIEKLKAFADTFVTNTTSSIFRNVKAGKSIDFENAVSEIYKDSLTSSSTKSIAVSTSQKSFKAVTSNTIDINNDYLDSSKTIKPDPNIHNVNKLIMYDGTNHFSKTATYQEMQKELDYRAESAGIPLNSPINRSKGYRWTIQSEVGSVASVTDPSSYETVLSPSFANMNDKKSITPNDFLNLYKSNKVTSTDAFMQKFITDKGLQDKYKQNTVWVDQTPYFIIGIGTTPDFAYPIIDQEHPIPDVKNQAIVFLNKRGYQRIHDGFRSAPTENYISIKFKNGISNSKKNVIKSEIETMARSGKAPRGSTYSGIVPKMSWPSNIKIVTDFNQANDGILLAEQRVAFLIKLKQTISALSRMTTLMLLLFVGSIIILVFSSLLASKRRIIATLLSLGYKKTNIAFSFATIALIIAAVPSLIGYLFGHFMQYAFINIFSNYWTLPIYGEVFSWMSLVIVVLLPFISIFLLIYLICLYQTRHNVSSMLRDNVTKYNFAPKILEYFKWFGVKFKYSISLTINNFWRLILVSITGIISVSAMIVGFSTIGKADYAYNSTSALSNYTYKVDLYSPTISGGTYNDVNLSELENLLYTKPNQKSPIGPTYPANWSTQTDLSRLDKPHWHIPGVGDAELANIGTISKDTKMLQYIDHYLRYKLQTKMLLNYAVGGSSNLNPWNIAQKLMPDNQRNIANTNEEQFKNVPIKIVNPENPTNPDGSFNTNYVKYFKELMDYQKIKKLYPYVISYQNVLTNMNDELYTYISTQYKYDNQLNNYHITGYNPNSKYLNIPKALTNRLLKNKGKSYVPILINKYIASKFNLSEGDTISMNVLNRTNRFRNGSQHQSKVKMNFKVEGILNTYDNNGIYTLQSIANNAIQLNSKAMPQLIGGEKNNYFNGVFTKEKSPLLLNSLPLYSPSGIYLATDNVNSEGWGGILDKVLADKSLWYNQNLHRSGYLATYGSTPLVSGFSTINWKYINQYTFKNISTLSSYLIFIIQLISMILSVLFAIIVSSLFIDSNKKRIATLWTLGYRRREITKIFLTTYMLPMAITIIFSLMISFAIVSIVRLLIMNFAYILIPFSIAWWMPLVAFSMIGIIFITSIIIAIFSMRGNAALEAFKEE